MDHIELWDKAKALMREELANVSYTTWIEQPLKPVYVVDDKLMLRGILTIGEAVRAHREQLKIKDVMITDYHTVSPDATVREVMPVSAQSPYPVAVIDETGQLQGIVTKASVLSSMVNEDDKAS